MTTLVNRTADLPQTHALVIGAGQYPDCTTLTRSADSRVAALARRFGPVTSPPASARAVAQWLMNAPEDQIAPLGSLELLESGGTSDQPLNGVRPAAPTFDAVAAAFDHWYARCNTHADNVAFFYFSGHGCAKVGQLLLLDDVGANPLRFFDNAVAFEPTVAGMTRNRAATQCFFVDACRDIPDELLDLAGSPGRPLVTPQLQRDFRHAPVLFSTGPGQPAYGTEDRLSPFTEALLRALDGLAAEKTPEGAWEVTTDRIGPAVERLLAFDGLSTADTQYPVSGGWPGRRSIRRLYAEPRVPFRLGCDPREALGSAQLTLTEVTRNRVEMRRPPTPAIWEDVVRADCYALEATFAAEDYQLARAGVPIIPPLAEFDLPVRRR
jgi:hypothetical protein